MNKSESIGPTALDLAGTLAKNPYTYPCGYPMFAITDDGGALCKDCCKTERDCIESSYPGDGWHVIALDINWEDGELYCDHCSSRIESAYAED